jgi:hypothetical protein
MAPIGPHVAAERSDLVHPAVTIEDADRAELDADRHRPPKYLAHFVRLRAGREIPIQMSVAEQRVAHSTPHTPGFVPGSLQRRR